ncbi:unnamed protein product [Protopolystoma xenopodis]|uniref:Uncharacterized protein n=1 Tax=Protopolystoma xenopodis TaxID=117903 RepID=A0A448WII8_9PLAT|nr:unnamed protein product [Protopolystoma xenopodis]
MKKRFVRRSHQKTTANYRCNAAVWLYYGVQVGAVHEAFSFASGENKLSFVHPMMDIIRAGTHFSRSQLCLSGN